MTDSISDDVDLERLIEQFTGAEAALREFVGQTDRLAKAEDRLVEARSELDTATGVLGEANQAVDTGVTALADAARQLGEITARIGELIEMVSDLDPAEFARIGEATQAEIHKLGTRLTEQIDAIGEANARGLADLKSDHAETCARVEARQDGHAKELSDAKGLIGNVRQDLLRLEESLSEQTAEWTGMLQTVSKRQTIVMTLIVVVAVLAAGALVAAIAR